MIQKLHSPVTVVSVFDHYQRATLLKRVLFDGRRHEIVKTGLRHTYREGRTLYHVFSVASQTLFFRLVLNTDTLAWAVTEIADGEVD